jgi:hypothetical protein
MRFVAAVPATMYINLQRATFVCDCGEARDALIADKD